MSTLPDDSEISLEEERFEVECWRYVGDPVGFGSNIGSQTLRVGASDIGKGSGSAQNEKSEGWFGLNKHKRSRTISLKKGRSDVVSPTPPPIPSGFNASSHLSPYSSKTLTSSSTSSTLSSSSTFLSPPLRTPAGRNGDLSELGVGSSTRKQSKGKKERSSFFGLGVGSRRNRREDVESWRRAKLVCQGDMTGKDSVVSVYDGDVIIYSFRPTGLQASDISVPHKSLYTDQPCIRISNIDKAAVLDESDITPTPPPDHGRSMLDEKRSFFKGASDTSISSLASRANSMGEVRRKTSTTPSLRSFASSHSLSVGQRPPSITTTGEALKTPATSSFPPQISPKDNELAPLTGPWLSPVSSTTSVISNASRRSSSSTYSTAHEDEGKDGLSPLKMGPPLPTPSVSAPSVPTPDPPRAESVDHTTPRANRISNRKLKPRAYASDESIPRISFHAAQPARSTTTTNPSNSVTDLALVFEDGHIQQAWLGLLKSLAKPELVGVFDGYTDTHVTEDPHVNLLTTRRLHRTLEVTVHDIKDLKFVARHEVPEPRNRRGIMRSISSGIGQTIKSLAEDDRVDAEEQKDSFFLEIRLDNVVLARTTVRESNIGLIWSETFLFAGIPEWDRLISSNSSEHENGLLSGVVVSQAISNPCKDNLNVTTYATGLPGGSVSLCHAGTALCSLDDVLRVLIDEEVQTPAATLFRANTPLTKLLETAMRIYAYEYVRSAVGPTVREVCKLRLVIDTPIGREALASPSEILRPYVQSLWNDIYMSRELFPRFLRKVLHHLMLAVSKQHSGSKKLQFQAVSSFLFLRLIGPAIMWPTMFDLVSAPPCAEVQRTLKTLAKPIMSLAFLVGASEQNQQDKATNDFVEANSAALTDYLEACATIDAKSHVFSIDQRVEDIASALVKRKSRLRGSERDAVYVLSAIGAIDLVKELAVISESKAVLPDSPIQRHSQLGSSCQKTRMEPRRASTAPDHVVVPLKQEGNDDSK
ncbi:hypothetical protein QFC19_003912 [Naganishia cerealis]|uniref:Uncharacterized protein n=1 Tax=Naganishia cerealis TaxID=610337 RepID=A0ACC2W1N4_9TREE|nr:hypothetical protein QFC19_003912 [Naganishia cerealis]